MVPHSCSANKIEGRKKLPRTANTAARRRDIENNSKRQTVSPTPGFMSTFTRGFISVVLRTPVAVRSGLGVFKGDRNKAPGECTHEPGVCGTTLPYGFGFSSKFTSV